MDERITPGVARLLEAEQQADRILARAREEADAIVAAANTRAQEITKGGTEAHARQAAASRSRVELEKEIRLIAEEGETRITRIRAAAEARLNDAVQSLIDALIGDP